MGKYDYTEDRYGGLTIWHSDNPDDEVFLQGDDASELSQKLDDAMTDEAVQSLLDPYGILMENEGKQSPNHALWVQLHDYALEHYSEGGQWITETHDLHDYQKYIDITECLAPLYKDKIIGTRTPEEAMAELKWNWELLQEDAANAQDLDG